MKQMNQQQLLSYIQETGFDVIDTNLFLDTHPDCQEALKHFCMVRGQFMEARAIYEATYGPLTLDNVNVENKWTWICQPWPWEGEC